MYEISLYRRGVAGMTITPMAFLSVNNGSVKVMPADYDTTFDRAVEILPEIIETVEQAIARTKPCASESEQE